MKKNKTFIKLNLILILVILFSTNTYSQTDTSTTKNKINSSEKIYLDSSEFTYANNQRYTIDGEPPLYNSKIKPIPAIITLGALSGIFYVQHQLQQSTIWKETGPFWIQEDGQWSFYLDKPGHFYGTYMASYLLSECLMLSGFSRDASVVWGSVLGLAYTTYVEILDGHSVGFGFSPSDFYADIAGASFFIAQHYVKFLQNFTPKFQYVKPSWIGQHDRIPAESFIDNYSSQTFWLSINVHNLLSEKTKHYWPPWLELGIGYGVWNLCDPLHFNCDPSISDPVSSHTWGNKKLLIGVDFNLSKLLPDGCNTWNWIRQGLSYFRLPAPVLEIGKTTRFYILFPFSFKLGNSNF